MDEAIKITIDIKAELGKHKLKDFKAALQTNVSYPTPVLAGVPAAELHSALPTLPAWQPPCTDWALMFVARFGCASLLQDYPAVKDLRKRVEEFAMQFPTIGFEKSTMRYA